MLLLYYLRKSALIIICSVSSKQISCIYLVLNVIQAAVITVGDYRLAHGLEPFQVVNNQAAEERCSVFKGRLINYDRGPLGLNTFHYALNG